MDRRRASIHWIPFADGGRRAPPPGPTYSSVARFTALADCWPQEAWSVVLGITEPADNEGRMTATIRMLASEAAPGGLLDAGSTFDLFEGSRCVAHGRVLEA